MPKRVVADLDLFQAALVGLEQRKAEIDGRIEEIRRRLGKASTSASPSASPGRKRVLSVAARKRIAAAQKKRWAEFRKKNGK